MPGQAACSAWRLRPARGHRRSIRGSRYRDQLPGVRRGSSNVGCPQLGRDPVRAGRRTQVLGGLKVGSKCLFLHSPGCDKYLECRATCVLDFYVHESCQRSGIGLALLEVKIIPSPSPSPRHGPGVHMMQRSFRFEHMPSLEGLLALQRCVCACQLSDCQARAASPHLRTRNFPAPRQ